MKPNLLQLEVFDDILTTPTGHLVGASSGFGRGTAARLASEGAKVVVAARRKEMLDELVTEIAASAGRRLRCKPKSAIPHRYWHWAIWL